MYVVVKLAGHTTDLVNSLRDDLNNLGGRDATTEKNIIIIFIVIL